MLKCYNIHTVIFMFFTFFAISGLKAEENKDQQKPTFYKIEEKVVLNNLKQLALEAASQNDDVLAATYAETYIKEVKNTIFLKNEAFDKFQEGTNFSFLREKYNVSFGVLPLFYLFSSLIGFFIALVLLFKKSSDLIATILISIFLVLHSSFIFHIFLYVTNLKYDYPHILMMTAGFSFLYAPLIYFYFKRFTRAYKFKTLDMLHLLPTFIVFMLLIPVYNFSVNEKLAIMFDVSLFDIKQYLPYLMFAKLVSLIVYGVFTLKEYSAGMETTLFTPEARKWQRNFVFLGMFYIVSYAVYGLTIIEVLPRFEFIYHLQIVAMSVMVMYIGFIANLTPFVFDVYLNKTKNKYEKSGLTPAFSLELKEQLLRLFEGKKIYRDNKITLDGVSSMLGVSRHNTSQVINEHFGLNFFEFINEYRIREALSLLEDFEKSKNRIVDIAYFVGFNNKVTFNKSFKKMLSITPSAYLKTLQMD